MATAGLLVALGLIIAIGLITYSNSFAGLLVFDEQPALAENPNIRSLRTVLSAPPDSTLAGRPVASLSFAINYALAPRESRDTFSPPPPGSPPDAWSGLYRNLWGYHATNLAIHILAALTLFGVVRRTLETGRLAPRFAPAATPLALAISCLWVAHPLGTAATTYIVQRVESMMALFYLLTLYCAIRAWSATGAHPMERTAHRAWVALAVVFCALGMGSKEVMVSAPLAVVLYDAIFFGAGDHPTATWRARLIPIWSRRWPLYLGLAATWILLAALVLTNPRPETVGIGLRGWSSWPYLKTQASVIVHYLRLVVVPWPLSLDYEWPAASSLAQVALQAVLLTSLVGFTLWGTARFRPFAFPACCFFLILAPTSSVLPITTEIAAEHRMYLPAAAAIVLVVTAVYRASVALAERVAAGRANVKTAVSGGLIVLAGAAVFACGSLSYQRNAEYGSEDGIWAATVIHQPANVRARNNYGWALLRQQRFAEAERQLRVAVALRADNAEAQSNLGIALGSQGQLSEGIEHLRRAVALAPDYLDALDNLAEALAAAGRDAEAVRAYRDALMKAPGDVTLMKHLARLLATAPEADVRDGGEAVALAERIVAASGGVDLDALDLMAAAYAEAGRFPEAVAAAEKAIAWAERLGRRDVAAEIERRLALYRHGQAFRRAPRAEADARREPGAPRSP